MHQVRANLPPVDGLTPARDESNEGSELDGLMAEGTTVSEHGEEQRGKDADLDGLLVVWESETVSPGSRAASSQTVSQGSACSSAGRGCPVAGPG